MKKKALTSVVTLLLLIAFGLGSQNERLNDAKAIGDEIIQSSRCLHPGHIGDCAAFCNTLRRCLECCSRGWPDSPDQEDYRNCRERCDDMDWL